MTPNEQEVLSLKSSKDISHLQSYLGEAIDALSSLDTLCSALELTVEELEAMLEEDVEKKEVDNEDYVC